MVPDKWWRIVPRILVMSNGGKSFTGHTGYITCESVRHIPTKNPELVTEVDLPKLIREPQFKRLDIWRVNAVGDVLACLSAARYIKKVMPHLEVNFYTSSDYLELCNLQKDVPVGVGNPKPMRDWTGERCVVDFNELLETDHITGHPRMNRMDRVLSAFGIQPPKETLDIMKLDVPKIPAPEKPTIAVSVRRQKCGECRTPPEHYVRKVCERLVEKGFNIYVMDGFGGISWAQGAISAPRTGLVQTLSNMANCKALLAPDSGGMWLAKSIPIPMCIWLGPTPAWAKVEHHPLFPQGVRVLQTNDWIGCPSCFEEAVQCDNTYACLWRADEKRFVDETVEKTMELVFGG